MNKSITLKHIGYRCSGVATINLWGGGQSSICMNEWDIAIDDIQSIISGVNDGKFGCESIHSASVIIYDVYQQNIKQYNRTIYLKKDELKNTKRGITVKDNKK